MDRPGSALDAVLGSLALSVRALASLRRLSCIGLRRLSCLGLRLGRLAALPLSLLWLPLSYLAALLRALFAPVLCILSHVLAAAAAVAAFIAAFEPLYTFLSAAAAIGILAGVALRLVSALITSYLAMQHEPDTAEQPSDQLEKNDWGPLTPSPAIMETEWYWAEPSPSRSRRPSGLLSQTIHEEDDDSDL